MRQAEQNILICRFFGEHVNRGAGDLTAFYGVAEIGFNEDAATGAIDDPDPVFHPREGVCIQQITGPIRQRRVDGNDIRARQQRLEFRPFRC